MPLKAFVRIHCSRCGALRDITMHEDDIHVKSDSHSCPKWEPEMGPPDPPRSFYINQAVILPDDREEWDKIQKEKPDEKDVAEREEITIKIRVLANGDSIENAEDHVRNMIGDTLADYCHKESCPNGFEFIIEKPKSGKTQPCPVCDTPLETPKIYFKALKRLREKLISHGKLAIKNENQLKKDGEI